MPQYAHLMHDVILLKDIEKKRIQDFFKTGQFKIDSYKKNTVIHFENDPCDRLEIILLGQVVVERLDESGGILTISEFSVNDVLGGNLLFSSNPYYPMTVTTRQPTTVLEIKKDLILELCNTNVDFLKTFIEYISDHATILSYKIKQHVNKTIRESLVAFLKHESKVQNTNRIKLDMTKKALADKIGVQRTSLSRELSKMEKDGLISYDAKSITLL